jgi:hypothetical protein
MIPGNKCIGGDTTIANPVQKKCSDKNNGKGRPSIASKFQFAPLKSAAFVKRTKIIFFLEITGNVFSSIDDGLLWNKVAFGNDVKISRVKSHKFQSERIFFYSENAIFVINDARYDLIPKQLNLPEEFNTFNLEVLTFHAAEINYYIYTAGGKQCPSNCFTKIYITKDGGLNFIQIHSWANDVYYYLLNY